MPCGAVRCRFLPCGGVLYRAARYSVLSLSYKPGIIWKKYRTRYRFYCNTRFVRTTLIEEQKYTSSSAQPSHTSAAQRSAVRCRAALCFPSNILGSTRNIRYQVPVCTCVGIFFWGGGYWFACPLSHLSVYCVFSPLDPCCRSERDLANKHIAQHRVIGFSYVALSIVKSLVARNHGPLSICPLRIQLYSCASVARGVSRPLSGALEYRLVVFC